MTEQVEPKIHFHCERIAEEPGDAHLRLPIENVRDACAVVAGWELALDTKGCKNSEYPGVYYRKAPEKQRERGWMGSVYRNDAVQPEIAAVCIDREDGKLYVYFFA